MNPELLRNLWLELTPRRMIQMAVVLVLILLTANLADRFASVPAVAQYLFYGIVVLWGARDAAQTVVGEIRERTWDFQRLSALTPFEMTWGKLLGATSYVWFGGLICLSVLIVTDVLTGSSSRVLSDLFYYLSIGLLGQGVALFASLIAVRRRRTGTRFNVFLYQATGAAAALFAWWGWQLVNPNFGGAIRVRTVIWWGATTDGRQFYLASLAVFLAWTLFGCYRLMRLELQMRNRPTVWLGFIAFMAAYMAGFERIGQIDAVAPLIDAVAPLIDVVSLRLVLANGTLVLLTYLAVLFEPKDRVLYRWLGEMLAKRRWNAVLSRLQCWMIAYAATMIGGVALAFHLSTIEGFPAPAFLTAAMVVAGLGFLTRDLGVFLFFGLAPGQKRGDMPAIISLGVLYLLLPSLLAGAGVADPAVLLYPKGEAGWIGATYAWAEAIAMWFAVLASRSRQTAALQPK